jgi:membrane fusion protein, multidrug efflux system
MVTPSIKTRVWSGLRRHPVLTVAAALGILYAGYELFSSTIVYCRDAYVTTDIVYIAPEVSGPIYDLMVMDNESVEKGMPLLNIDPEPFKLARDSQQAALDLAQENLKKAQDDITTRSNEITANQAIFNDASTNRDRILQLSKQGAVSVESVDSGERIYEVALANLDKSKAERIVAVQQVAVQKGLIAQAAAGLAQAQYEIDRTTIKAPVAGRVAPLRVRAGQYLQTGAPIIAIVSQEDWHIVMNLPERYLRGLKPGHKVWFSIGSDPWRLHSGTVRSIAPGISLTQEPNGVLPYVDPSIDWIRLPRRFPVEIDMGPLPDEQRLYQGSNATIWTMML